MRLQHGVARGRAIPAVEVAAGAVRSLPPPPRSLVALGLARPSGRHVRWRGSEQPGMGEREQRGGVGTRRPNGKAAAGEGRRVGEG
jgi:hypothetical protein